MLSSSQVKHHVLLVQCFGEAEVAVNWVSKAGCHERVVVIDSEVFAESEASPSFSLDLLLFYFIEFLLYFCLRLLLNDSIC